VSSTAVRLRVPPEDAGARLDRFLAERLPAPRNQVQRWIREGRVLVDSRPATRPAREVAGGEWIECTPAPPEAGGGLVPEQAPLAVLYEDAELVVIDKPSGLSVHPGAGRPSGTLAHRLLARYPEMAEVGGPGRPGIVHRLDKGTTGVLVAARTPLAYRRLSADFAARRVGKTYLAIVHGVPRAPAGDIAAAIGRHPTRRREMAVRPAGRPARTRWRRLATGPGVALLALDLETGRTHQIRVHLKSIGHPLLGDPVYGEARWRAAPRGSRAALRDFPRPALHAWRLALDHPVSGERLRFEAPPPDDLRRLWREIGGGPAAVFES
jgi:23S rRNA pseudouridine1911/1915/1917 synthase